MMPSQSLLPRRLVAVNAAIVATSLWVLASSGVGLTEVVGIREMLPLVAALTFINLLAVRLPRGDVIVLEPAIGVGALLVFGGHVSVVAAFLGGFIGSVLLRGHSGKRVEIAIDLSRRILVIWAASFASAILVPVRAEIGDVASIMAALLVGLVYMSVDLGTYGAIQAARERTHLLTSTASVARSVFFLYAGQVCLGIVLAVVYPEMGALAVVVLGVLAMILLNAFNMYLRTKMMYQQTIHALSRASSLQADHAGPDSRLVADLSVAVGRRLGMHGAALERLSFAALLRDIGRLGQQDVPDDDSIHAGMGADLVESIPFLAGTAGMIRDHHMVFSDLSQQHADAATGAACIHLCADFVERAQSEGALDSSQGRIKLLQRLAQEDAGIYGARVIDALTREIMDVRSDSRYQWVVPRP
jgi:hypothetical protein